MLDRVVKLIRSMDFEKKNVFGYARKCTYVLKASQRAEEIRT